MIWLITFSSYGTHLPGDFRGSFDHVRNGERRYIPPNSGLEAFAYDRMRQPAFALGPHQREAVRDAIVEKCAFGDFPLIALHVRATHVHGIVDATSEPSQILHAWKAYSTRRLRGFALVTADRTIWTHGGNSMRVEPESVHRAIRYVLEEQGTPMATYCGDFR